VLNPQNFTVSEPGKLQEKFSLSTLSLLVLQVPLRQTCRVVSGFCSSAEETCTEKLAPSKQAIRVQSICREEGGVVATSGEEQSIGMLRNRSVSSSLRMGKPPIGV
jgi:hypothetical protein